MNLAFYYHIPICSRNNGLYMPGFLGVFIDSMASMVETLYLIMHDADIHQMKDCDYMLAQSNVIWINLGKRSPAWNRTFFPGYCLKKELVNRISHCDALIVRSPSPLAPHFSKFVKGPKVYFMIVGNYIDDAGHLKSSTWRNRIIYYYLHYYDQQFTRQIAKTDVLVNSPFLYEKYKSVAKSIHQIRTTTLSRDDFYERNDTCTGQYIQLLYTGRVEPAKGLTELVHAFAILRRENFNVILNIVGWEDGDGKPYENELISLAGMLGVSNEIVFHGKKQIGQELNEMYRMADIYVLPSYYEGFPRTIWEAMANSLPVIATKVGGIPNTLTDQENVLLIEPKHVDQIVCAIKKMIQNESFRRSLIKQGRSLALENTLEIQTDKMISLIRKDLNLD